MKCPLCGTGNLVRESRDLMYSYGGRSTVVRQCGDFCTACNEGIFSTDESEKYLAALKEFRSEVDREPLVPSEVRRIRKKLGLTQREAGDIFGGGIRAFSQYERGETRQGKALDKLLRLLDHHPELLDELRTRDAA
ncbi:type II TA system antitoxin MqsA family protein [Geomobilimonas luticola]|uniref:Type II toxin-antitoxin system MqsA family antitoxin n=1 Tax=Geomobilimonas luticola TaxID=1114878 RepID=A0ABS5SED7_9BACT|nr:type II TA system antitoxin MqsA family protein [Geomobilimonas luticola]MBT0652874.1 type II toxin-antitoxin system MqsA family antitoxin [Geomobilimonas luticola]